MRDKWNKFFVPFEEYEYNMFPPFINTGAYVVSNKIMHKIFHASYFVKRFRFDDVYLGIIAKKCGIKLYHSEYFWRFRQDSTIEDLNFTIASHEFSSSRELEHTWFEQTQLGHA